MKTLKQIALTAIMIILVANVSYGSSFKKFQMMLSNGNSIEVLSKVETLVEENLPVLHNAIFGRADSFFTSVKILSKEEMPVEEEMVIPAIKASNNTLITTLELMPIVHIQETEVSEDLGFDTKVVFENYRREKLHQLTSAQLASFVKHETEVAEDTVLCNLIKAMAK